MSRTRWQQVFASLLDIHDAVPVLDAVASTVEREPTRSEYEAARRTARNLSGRTFAASDGTTYVLLADRFRGVNVEGREQARLYLLRVPAEVASDAEAVAAHLDWIGLEAPRPTVREVAALTGFPRSSVGRYLRDGRPKVGAVPTGTDATPGGAS